MRNKISIGVGIAIAILVAGFLYNKYRVAPELKIEMLALTDLNGNKVSLNSFQNKNLFINFFATWCGPCMHEVPSLTLAQQILLKEHFQFIFISDEPIARLQNFSERNDGKFLILHSKKSLQQYKIFSIPASYVLNINLKRL